MKLVIIGTGYVGLVSGACFADLGHSVVCVDRDISKIKRLNAGIIPIYEPGLEDIVKRNCNEGRLVFTALLKDALLSADAVLLAVGTPTDDVTGRADLQYVFDATKEIAENIVDSVVVITKSTVPVGTGSKILDILRSTRPELTCEVASNPEFLREGSAVLDFMSPDRVIIGSESPHTKKIMQILYSKMIASGTPILYTNIETAELIKYSSNAFLAMKIAFTNEIADICEGVGADIDLVIKGMGMDERIGNKYMQPGPGYGGSCFPKDTKALTHIALDAGFPTRIIEAVINANDARKEHMARKIIAACGNSVKGKEIAILGLTFKANTDDMRYSPSLVIIPELIKLGAKIRTYDPVGTKEAKKALVQSQPNIIDNLQFCQNSDDAIKNADAVVILTEWPEFKEIDLIKAKTMLNEPVIVDLRNLLDGKIAISLGYKYISIGR